VKRGKLRSRANSTNSRNARSAPRVPRFGAAKRRLVGELREFGPGSRGPSSGGAVLIPRERRVEFWANRIAAKWQASVRGFLECGRLLQEAKADLVHGEFERMVERDLPFGSRTAQRLMAIAKDVRIANPTFASLLPGSWDTVYELTKLKDGDFHQSIADGSIHPEMTKRDVLALRKTVAANSDQLDLFTSSLFCLSSVGRKLEKALRRHIYSQAKLTKNSALIIEAVVISIRALETLVSKVGESDGAAKIEAEFSRLERRVHGLMGPCRVPG
jgi:hypothetical protein